MRRHAAAQDVETTAALDAEQLCRAAARKEKTRLIEEKTKEPQTTEPAQLPQKKCGQKLRSLWAQFQCMQLLRRHRFRRKTQHHVNNFAQKLLQNHLALLIGEALYALGFSTEYVFVRAWRAICRGTSWVLHWLRDLLHGIVSMAFPGAAQMFRDLFGPVVLFFRGMASLVAHAHRVRKEKGFGAAVKASAHYLASGVRRNVRTLPRMAMYILPVLALAGMVTVVQRTIRQPYALEVQVNGQTVGYVANEDVFNSAREAVQERINYAGTDKTEWTVEPSYTISIAHDVLDENEMANAILSSASDQISEGTALYLDGELTAVCADGGALQSYLNNLLIPYEDPDSTNTTVGFNKEVTLENGIYFNESFQDENDVEAMLSGVQQQEKVYTVQVGDTLWSIAQKNDLTFRELCELNPNFKGAALTETSNIQAGDELIVTKQEATLEVRITKIETWQEEIPYTSETTKSNEYNVGTKKTTQAGENGIRSVTAQRVYDTNGTQLSQQILSTEVIKEPVTEKIVVGTKKVTTSTSYITGSGQFIWPVPGYRYCSRWYGGNHKGVDICAAAGTPIYASAGGTVTKAGYNKAGAGTGYGYSIIISHGNGYTTVYAHCLSLVVHAGQTVKQGQLIGYVGSTGRSSGNHCHFEIRRNGSYIAPQNVFNRSKYK